MATSSIFASFDITNKQGVDNFISALELSEQFEYKKDKNIPKCITLSDQDEIRAFLNKRNIAQ